MKQYLIGFVMMLFFCTCIETDIDYDFEYQEKPVSIGFLDSVWGIRVWVGKTAKIIGNDSSVVQSPEVMLSDRNNNTYKIDFLSEGVFVMNNPIEIIRSQEYLFKSLSKNFPIPISSNYAALPETIPIKNIDAIQFGNGGGRDVFIQFDDPEGFNAYFTYIQRFKNDTALDEDFNSDPFFIPGIKSLFSDREFNGTRHTLKIENFQIDKINDLGKSVTADSLKVTLIHVSKIMFDLFLSLNTPEPGTGEPFFDPTIIPKSNEKGIAILSSYSQSSSGVKLK